MDAAARDRADLRQHRWADWAGAAGGRRHCGGAVRLRPRLKRLLQLRSQAARQPHLRDHHAEIDLGADEFDWAPDKVLGNVRIQVDRARPASVGIGPEEAVGRYLDHVAHGELIDFSGDRAEFDLHPGRAPRTPPGRQRFWVAKSQGAGEQALTWDAEFGRWTAVVMNADGARGIHVEADAGIKLDWAIWAGLGLIVVGLLISGGAALLIVLIGRGSRAT